MRGVEIFIPVSFSIESVNVESIVILCKYISLANKKKKKPNQPAILVIWRANGKTFSSATILKQ